MKLRSKEPYWLLRNGLVRSYPSLNRNISCDVLVIGAGITGSLMAYQFSQEGYKTVIVDKRDVGFGSTSATTAMLQYEIDEPLFRLIKNVGERAAVDSYREGVKAIRKVEQIVKDVAASCDFGRKKSLFIAHSEESAAWLATEYRCRKKFSFDVAWISKHELRKQYGVVGHGAILSASGGTLDAYNLTHALLNYSRINYPLEIFDHTSVDEVLYGEEHNVATTDNGNTIHCKKLIYATGYETQRFVKEKIVDLISTYVVISEPLAKVPSNFKSTILWNTEDPYLYMRTTGDNRIIVGGADEGFKNPEWRDKLIDRKEDVLLKSIQNLIPELSIVSDFRWAGTFGVTKDSLPYIGTHQDYPNTFFVLGFGGNGITFSVMGMDILSDAVAGRKNIFLEYFKFNR